MEGLTEFLSKDFAEQMELLIKMGNEKDARDLPKLFQLNHQLTGDKTVDTMIEHTLRDVLGAHPQEIAKILESGTVKDKIVCLEAVGQKEFKETVPALIHLVETDRDLEIIRKAFIAMSSYKESIFLEQFRANIHHEDEIISALSIEMIGTFNDTSFAPKLEKIITLSEQGARYEICTIQTAKAIETLALLAKTRSSSLRFLLARTAHKNPTARRIIHEALVSFGEALHPYFERDIPNQSQEQRIFAANILRRIGKKEGGQILVAAIDKQLAHDPNVRAAIYESLGEIQFMKGLVCLMDALEVEEGQVLMSVVTSLNLYPNPAVVEKIKSIIRNSDTVGQRVLETVVFSGAENLFRLLYPDPDIGPKLMAILVEAKDDVIRATFASVLESFNTPEAETDKQKLDAESTPPSNLHVLAVDDSRAVRSFYRSIISKMSMPIETKTAENGRDALFLMEVSPPFDLVITDLNMPIMDGIEFTRILREDSDNDHLPIIMGTTESRKSQMELAIKCGVNDFLFKPITGEKLKSKLELFLAPD